MWRAEIEEERVTAAKQLLCIDPGGDRLQELDDTAQQTVVIETLRQIGSKGQKLRRILDENWNLPLEERPRWDCQTHILTYLGDEMCRFSRQASSQMSILDAFQHAGWPSAIPVPAELREGDPRRTIRDLKKKVEDCPLTFCLSGEQITFQLKLPAKLRRTP